MKLSKKLLLLGFSLLTPLMFSSAHADDTLGDVCNKSAKFTYYSHINRDIEPFYICAGGTVTIVYEEVSLFTSFRMLRYAVLDGKESTKFAVSVNSSAPDNLREEVGCRDFISKDPKSFMKAVSDGLVPSPVEVTFTNKTGGTVCLGGAACPDTYSVRECAT